MSSRPAGGALGRVLERIGRTRGYRCEMCELSFEAERLNCPACGGPVEET